MIRFTALDTETVRALQNGAPDANGQTPERAISDGGAIPCRHCLRRVPTGEPYLILGYRPFPALQPYAETGPIFLCASPCTRGGGDAAIPPFLASPSYIVRGYTADDRIRYGTGRVTETAEIPAVAETMLANDDIAYLHIRSASNNCYHCRVDRA